MPLPILSLAALWMPLAPPDRLGPMRWAPEDRIVVGRWFGGRKHEDVEEIVWASAASLGAILEPEDLPVFRAAVPGRLLLLFRLAALERQDPLEFGGDTRPGDDVTKPQVRVYAVSASDELSRIRGESLPVRIVRGRSARTALGVGSFGAFVRDWLEIAPWPRSLLLGPNQVAWGGFLGEIDEDARTAVAYRVELSTPRRKRIANFRRFPRIDSSR